MDFFKLLFPIMYRRLLITLGTLSALSSTRMVKMLPK